jgi:hypothetical protein
VQQQFKLCDAHDFNKLKFKTNSPNEQAKQLVVSIPLSKRKENYKLALLGDGTTNHVPTHDTNNQCELYVNPKTNMEHRVPLQQENDILNETLISPTDSSNNSDIIAMDPPIIDGCTATTVGLSYEITSVYN